jgi:ligand-binding sensor domain-containing protein
MREICMSGLTSGMWKRSRVTLVRHRQTKGPETDRLHLHHRATSRLYSLWVGTDSGLAYIPSTAVDHFDRSLVTMYHPGVGPSDRISCLLIRDGILWVGTARGLYRFDRGHFVTVIPDEPISTMDQTSDGHLLIITEHGFVEWDGARILRYPEFPRQLGVRAMESFKCTKIATGFGGSAPARVLHAW